MEKEEKSTLIFAALQGNFWQNSSCDTRLHGEVLAAAAGSPTQGTVDSNHCGPEDRDRVQQGALSCLAKNGRGAHLPSWEAMRFGGEGRFLDSGDSPFTS